MQDITLKGKMILDKKERNSNDNEFFSLKLTDSIYKKNIGKFLEILSSHFM